MKRENYRVKQTGRGANCNNCKWCARINYDVDGSGFLSIRADTKYECHIDYPIKKVMANKICNDYDPENAEHIINN